MNTKTTPPPCLRTNRSLALDEVTQTYARDAARQLARPTVPCPRPDASGLAAHALPLEVDAMFCAEAIVAEPRSTVLSRAVQRVGDRPGRVSVDRARLAALQARAQRGAK